MSGNYGFNSRRKRNLDLGLHYPQPKTETNINWGDKDIELEEEDFEEIELEPDLDEDELEVGYEYAEEPAVEDYMDKNQPDNADNGKDIQLFIDGKPFVPKQLPKKQTFADTHVRITTYIENNLHQIIHMLLEQGQIESISKLINDSIKEHLMNYYQNDN